MIASSPRQTPGCRPARLWLSSSAMPKLSLSVRVGTVETGLSSLRGDVASMREEFTTLRADVAAFRGEVAANFDELRTAMRAEIRAGDEETRRQMRVLHEEVISRIALLGEGKRGKRPVR